MNCGCHGVAVEPPERGEAYGTFQGPSIAELRLIDGWDGEVVGTRLWNLQGTGPEGQVVLYDMWGDDEGTLVLVIDGRPVLWVSADRCSAATGHVPDPIARQLVSTFAVPLAAQRAGALVLHASAAVRDGRAVVVCARSGTGKSSVLTALADAGWAPLSEDLVAIDLGGPTAWPGPPWVRLDPGVPGPAGSTELFRNADKVGWSLRGRWDRPAPVAHLLVLEPNDPAPTERVLLDRKEVIAAVAPHAPWYEHPDRRARALFGAAVRLAGVVPVSRVRFQRGDGWRAEAVELLSSLLD